MVEGGERHVRGKLRVGFPGMCAVRLEARTEYVLNAKDRKKERKAGRTILPCSLMLCLVIQ